MSLFPRLPNVVFSLFSGLCFSLLYNQNGRDAGHEMTGWKILVHISHMCKALLQYACWYEIWARMTVQRPFHSTDTHMAFLWYVFVARDYRVPRARRTLFHSGRTWMAFLRYADECGYARWTKPWTPFHSMDTCKVSHHCARACVCWGWMTARNVLCTRYTDVADISGGRVTHVCVICHASRRICHTTNRGIFCPRCLYILCTLGACHGNIDKQTLSHIVGMKIHSQLLQDANSWCI